MKEQKTKKKIVFFSLLKERDKFKVKVNLSYS